MFIQNSTLNLEDLEEKPMSTFQILMVGIMFLF